MGFVSKRASHRSQFDFEEEILSIPESIGLSSGCFNHIVHTFDLSRRDRELGMIDDSHQVLLYRVAEGEYLRDFALSGKPYPCLHAPCTASPCWSHRMLD